MILISKRILFSKLRTIATKSFGNLVKAVVDVEKEIMVIDASLHSDEEAYLLSRGSKQENLWGVNLYTDQKGDDFVEFDSMINLRPVNGNLSRGVDKQEIRKKIKRIVNMLVKE